MHIKGSEFGFSVLVESTGKQIMQPLEGGAKTHRQGCGGAGTWEGKAKQ